jgi:putative cardiolipin synthase
MVRQDVLVMVMRRCSAMNRFLLVFCGWVILGGCATILPEKMHHTASYALKDTAQTRIGRDVTRLRSGRGNESGFRLLARGRDAFLARVVLAQAADRSIDAQYYLLHSDLTGQLFIHQLLQAAERGVRVRLLVDDMDIGERDRGARLLDAHPNVEVRLFNPFHRGSNRTLQLLTRFGSVTRRMHNKSFTVDNQMTVVGGRNIGDAYFQADPDLQFSDLDVLGIGPVAGEVSASFDRYWNHSLAYPVADLVPEQPTAEQAAAGQRALEDFVEANRESSYLRELKQSELARGIRSGKLEFQWGAAHVVADDPDKLVTSREGTAYRLTEALRPVFNDADEELIVFSPYFVPGEQGVAFLSELVGRGVRVRILTNSLASTDVAVVHAGYAKYRKDLLRAGIELFEMMHQPSDDDGERKHLIKGSSKASLHTKSFVIDRERVFIGSLNLDPRSVVENSEIGVVIRNAEIGTGMADWFDANIARVAFRLSLETADDGREVLRWHRNAGEQRVVYEIDPYTSWWQRFFVGAAALLPIESQL